MNLNLNDLLIVIGEQTLQIKALSMTVDAQAKRLKELEPEKKPDLKSVEAPSGTG